MDPRITFKNNLRGYEPDETYLQRRGHHVKNSLTSNVRKLNESTFDQEESLLSKPRKMLDKRYSTIETPSGDFLTTYMKMMSHKRETSAEKSEMIKHLQQSLSPRQDQGELRSFDLQKPITESTRERSPLQKAMDDELFAKKIAKMNYNSVMREAAATGQRFHPNSIEPASETIKVKENPPSLPAYGVK